MEPEYITLVKGAEICKNILQWSKKIVFSKELIKNAE